MLVHVVRHVLISRAEVIEIDVWGRSMGIGNFGDFWEHVQKPCLLAVQLVRIFGKVKKFW